MEQHGIKYIYLPTLLNILSNIEGKSIMDIGCGEGTFARLLMNQGAAAVFGVDSAPRITRKYATIAKVSSATVHRKLDQLHQ